MWQDDDAAYSKIRMSAEIEDNEKAKATSIVGLAEPTCDGHGQHMNTM